MSLRGSQILVLYKESSSNLHRSQALPLRPSQVKCTSAMTVKIFCRPRSEIVSGMITSATAWSQTLRPNGETVIPFQQRLSSRLQQAREALWIQIGKINWVNLVSRVHLDSLVELVLARTRQLFWPVRRRLQEMGCLLHLLRRKVASPWETASKPSSISTTIPTGHTMRLIKVW